MYKDFSWVAVMRYCHFELGIPPAQFWNMTMVEVLELIANFSENQAVSRADLDYMMKNFR